MSTAIPKISQAQLTFFGYLFGEAEGYLCIGTGDADLKKTSKDYFKQHFFRWPTEGDKLVQFLELQTHRKNVWYCTSLLASKKRIKDNCLPGNIVWADLDACNPKDVEPVPSLALQSSNYHYQAIWRADRVLEPYEQEEFSKRIAYKYNSNGADVTGWDLTQLLRVPFTFNYKYDVPPQVEVLHVHETLVPVGVFQGIAVPESYVPSQTSEAAESLPPLDLLPPLDVINYKYKAQLSGTGFGHLFVTVPPDEENWSGLLWKLMNLCFEAGMDEFEVFAVALEAGCNKYKRDNRPVVHLWEDVLRAQAIQQKTDLVFGSKDLLSMPDIMRGDVPTATLGFVDDYSEWAEEITDAVPAYHELCGFMLLSATMAAGLKLYPAYAPTGMHPNLWGLVLGDSTLTRKTTAMRLAMDMLAEVDREIILATDGSVEGLLSGLGERPSRTSLFFKDEVTGFFDSINRKDYLAGMQETLTNLYDVPKVLTRRLRKETITITSPVFIFFGGGIRDKVYSLVTDEYVLSGFLPRFIVVSGEADLAKIRRTGPSNVALNDKRDVLQRRVADLYERFNRTGSIKVGGISMEVPMSTRVELTADAWERYGEIETLMVESAHASSMSMLALPTFERLSRSLLKMCALVAASDSSAPQGGKGDAPLVVTVEHVIKAASYIQKWGYFTVDLILNSGKGATERQLDKVLRTINKYPGILRGQVMRTHALSSREANEILTTLEDRGYITISKVGKGYKLKAV